MPEAPYSNRQIELLLNKQAENLDKQSADLKSHMDSSLSPILSQTTRTNGRVTKLEDRVETNSADLARLKTYFKLVAALWTLLATIATALIGNLIHL